MEKGFLGKAGYEMPARSPDERKQCCGPGEESSQMSWHKHLPAVLGGEIKERERSRVASGAALCKSKNHLLKEK